VLLPRYTLMIMRDCLTASTSGEVGLLVETAHWQWMKSKFSGNSLFLDIGAAAGTMTVPYALSFPESLRVVSFEPSQRARDYLATTLTRNGVRNVTVLPFALSDVAGSLSFMELPEDASGKEPYLPEGSRLKVPTDQLSKPWYWFLYPRPWRPQFYPGAVQYAVEVCTLDSLAEQLRFDEAETIVVKIDVEGFEDRVLKGALKTLKRFKPYLSIDIHNHPGRLDMTDEACMAILTPQGYQFERMGHVLLASAR
jgi:FkbM family methyltransferase